MPRITSARERFIDGGLACFHTKGYKGTSIEDIADAAGMLKGSFYNHFESKEALAVVVVTKYAENTAAGVVQTGPPTAYRRLKNHFMVLAADQEQVGYLRGCLMSNFSVEISQTGELLRAATEQAFERWYSALAVVVRQAQKEGDIDQTYDADQFARFLANSWEGATNYAKVTRNSQPLDDFFAFIFPKKKR